MDGCKIRLESVVNSDLEIKTNITAIVEKGVCEMDVRNKCKLSKLLIVAAIVGLLTPVAVFADAASDAAYEARIKKLEAVHEARIKKLEGQVRSLFNELAKVKADQARPPAVPAAPAVDQEQVARMVAKAIADSDVAPSDVPQWVKNMQWFGDFRFRFEEMDETDTVGNDQQRRFRIRARLGLKAKVNDEWDAVFRLVTGSNDENSATSTNQTLDNDFSTKNINLDWAYAHWHPVSHPGLDVYAGKMKNPFFRVGGNQLIWDDDVSPEGGAMNYNWVVNNSVQAFINAGVFVVQERGADADTSLFAMQGYAKHKFDNNTQLIAGAGLYCFTNIDGEAALGPADATNGRPLLGNTPTAGGGRYEYDYDVLEAFGEYAFHCGAMPMSVFGSYINNQAAPNTKNTGYLVGFKINKAKKPGSWQFSYDFRDVDPDATWAGMTESDFMDGGIDGRGHKLGFKYQLAKNVATGVTLFYNDRHNLTNNRTDSFKRLQWDLLYKFK